MNSEYMYHGHPLISKLRSVVTRLVLAMHAENVPDIEISDRLRIELSMVDEIIKNETQTTSEKFMEAERMLYTALEYGAPYTPDKYALAMLAWVSYMNHDVSLLSSGTKEVQC